MGDVGFTEMAVILVVAIFVFGPDKLPDFARQAGRFLRQVRRFTESARDELRNELGPEFADLELSDLDPRKAVRKHIQEVWDEDPGPVVPVNRGHRPLRPGELPPYDVDAT